MRIATVGRAVFAAVLITLGVLGLVRADFAPVWQPPDDAPARAMLSHVGAVIFLGAGVGLLVRRLAGHAARLLTVSLVVWIVAFRVREIVVSPGEIGAWYGCAETLVVLVAAWLLYIWFATAWDRRHVPFAIGPRALRFVRVAYGLALIPFGLAHFLFLERTISMVPSVMPAPALWAYATGIAFFAATAAIVSGVLARLASILVAIQIGGFTATVFWPFVMVPEVDPFLWNELAVSVVLTAAAWVIASSYRGISRAVARSGTAGAG